jgi:iron complex transport system substrate-binding protein
LLLAALLLAGCAPAAEQKTGWYTFVDSTGTTVTVQQKPQRVAVLFSSYAEIWSLAGGTVSITVGESVQRGFAPETALLVDGGAGKTVDVEALLAAQPQLVIGSADIPAQVQACKTLNAAGIPAALFRVDTFEEYLSMLKICTDLTENGQRYTYHGVTVQLQVRALRQQAAQQGQKPTYLFIRVGSTASATKAKRAPDNFVCTMLDQLGGRNIADEAAVLLDGLSLEYVMEADPQYIFLSPMGNEAAARAYIDELFAQPGWAELTAVQQGNWCFLSKELFHFKPNQRWDEAYKQLAQLLYPDEKWN